MRDIDLRKISDLISEKLKSRVEIVKCEKIGSGYHSDGFKISAKNGRSFFLKHVRSAGIGFEIPERKISSLLVSQGMGRRAGARPGSVGVILNNKNQSVVMPEIAEETKIYQVQEFETGSASYWSLLQQRKQKTKMDMRDLSELKKIVKYIVSVHRIKHPSKNTEKLNEVYNAGIRNVLAHPELTITLLHYFPKSHAILPPQKQKEYVGLMLSLVHQWKDRSERLCALHGDFWGSNLFFRENGSAWVIDYSRIPWGDPGIDVGWWLAQYLWLWHETDNDYFKELGESFLKLYAQKMKDKEIRQAASLAMGFCGVVNISPRIYPNLNIKVGKKFLKNILEILKEGKFVWKK